MRMSVRSKLLRLSLSERSLSLATLSESEAVWRNPILLNLNTSRKTPIICYKLYNVILLMHTHTRTTQARI